MYTHTMHARVHNTQIKSNNPGTWEEKYHTCGTMHDMFTSQHH